MHVICLSGKYSRTVIKGDISNRHDNNHNQRTSGPVNAHLTPGPGIYFNAFIHVFSPRQGQTTPWGQMLMSTESPLLQDLKQSL